MNEINTTQGTDPNGQQPFTAKSLLFLQNAYKEALNAISIGLTLNPTIVFGGISLYGCVNTGSGTTYNISSGAIYYNGEVFLVDSASFTTGAGQVAVCSIVVTNPPPDPITFEDGVIRNVHNVRKIVISAGASGSGAFNYVAMQFFNEAWNVVGTTGGSNGVTVQPSFQNAWTFDVFPLRFKKDKSGFVVVNGVVKSGVSGTVVFTLPVGYRPSTIVRLPVLVANGSGMAWATINTSGDFLVFYTGSGSKDVSAVRFPID